jgi:hypothetical protein
MNGSEEFPMTHPVPVTRPVPMTHPVLVTHPVPVTHISPVPGPTVGTPKFRRGVSSLHTLCRNPGFPTGVYLLLDDFRPQSPLFVSFLTRATPPFFLGRSQARTH